MTGGPPVPARGNLHNALALALGKRTQESDKTLIAAVYKLVATVAVLRGEVVKLRRQLAETRAQAGPDLFTAFDDREAS